MCARCIDSRHEPSQDRPRRGLAADPLVQPRRRLAPAGAALHPGTRQPVGPEDLAPIFPMSIILQEVSGEPEHEIPDEVREAMRCGGRRRSCGRSLRAGARDQGVQIYYKYEGDSPSGRTSPIPPCRRRSTARRTGASVSRPRPARASGARRSPLRRSSTGSSARSSWSASVPPEAVPAGDDGDLRRHRALEPVSRRTPAAPRWRTTRTRSARSGSPSPRPSSAPPPTRRPPTRSAPCSTTCSCTRP